MLVESWEMSSLLAKLNNPSMPNRVPSLKGHSINASLYVRMTSPTDNLNLPEEQVEEGGIPRGMCASASCVSFGREINDHYWVVLE